MVCEPKFMQAYLNDPLMILCFPPQAGSGKWGGGIPGINCIYFNLTNDDCTILAVKLKWMYHTDGNELRDIGVTTWFFH